MTSLHGFMRHPLPHTWSLGITSVGCLTERGTTVHCSFSPWLTPPELADHVPSSPTEVGGRVTTRVARCISKHPVAPAPGRGPAFTEMAKPGTASSTRFGHATRYAPKPALLLHICLAEVTLTHKALLHARSQSAEPVTPCSILYPPPKTSSPLPPPCAKAAWALRSAAPANLLNFGPGSLCSCREVG